MKKLLVTIATLALTATPVFAETSTQEPEANGHRIGIGFSSTKDVTYDSVKLGTGVKLEYGYEFNNIVGINLSYAGYSDSASEYGLTLDVDGSTIKIDTDLGYTFHFEQWALKPYAAIGIVRHNEEWRLLGEKESMDDTKLFFGIGARATIKEHYYADARLEGFATDYADYGQFSMTFGYRF
ncbi:hypothetical protein VIN01S_12860 [Vibrio inusitatus NBRC 102082]|uniref:Outer membrane protein beta-barrel domain-containing protein n=1 Tax=Vibrio inusitatus NBRC 102082 TaxID=1219070 RepID=A0A4Y3HUQ3_9VIBR|nr:porin family protein [Vibrio inusitatus]GEA50482.1 hypothetical protein VIN01S_12860 [Vibrio inusitatus NBRC 102082]